MSPNGKVVMLVLTRKLGEEVVIAGEIRLTVLEIHGQRIRLGITAPPTVRVVRTEVLTRQAGPEKALGEVKAEVVKC